MKKIAALVIGLGLCATTNAVVISYSTTNLGGNAWQYEYSIENDGSAVALIEQFTIFFAPDLYADLAVVAAPSDWDPIAIEPDALLLADGFFDALALGPGLGVGETISNFIVQFSYLAAGSPGDQAFDVVDPFSFATLASGTTSRISVPAPGTALLLLLGFVLMALPAGWRRSNLPPA